MLLELSFVAGVGAVGTPVKFGLLIGAKPPLPVMVPEDALVTEPPPVIQTPTSLLAMTPAL